MDFVAIQFLDILTLTFPTRMGMFIEFVAKPIPNVIAASHPQNLAVSSSSSRWMARLPIKIEFC